MNGHDQYDIIGERYEMMKTLPVVRHVEQPLVAALTDDLTGRSVIDLGCGTGFYSRRMRRNGATSVLGVDRSSEMIRAARDQQRDESLDIRYRRINGLDELGVAEHDVALAVYLFNYARDQGELDVLVAGAARTVRPGGELRAVVANPHLRFDDTRFGNYGITFSSVTSQCEFTEVNVRVQTHPEIRFTAYLPTRTAFDTAFQRSGLPAPHWTVGAVSDAGLDEFGREYWLDIYDNIPWASLSATTPYC